MNGLASPFATALLNAVDSTVLFKPASSLVHDLLVYAGLFTPVLVLYVYISQFNNRSKISSSRNPAWAE